MSIPTQHGYLVIADISGYTSFVAKTELEHSREILSELLELMVGRFQPLMTISKLEGDAVFAYVPKEVFVCSETLIDFIESLNAFSTDPMEVVELEQAMAKLWNDWRDKVTHNHDRDTLTQLLSDSDRYFQRRRRNPQAVLRTIGSPFAHPQKCRT